MQNQRAIESERRKPLVEAQNGFLFRFDKASSDKSKWYWRCNFKGCKARAVSDVNSVNLFVTQPKHIDFASPNNLNYVVIFEIMQERLEFCWRGSLHENDPTLPLRGRQNKKIADRNRKIKSLLDNYTSKPPEDRNPLIFLKAAQRFLLKHDYSETAQVEENNNDDQDQEN
ncbi:FLYWCH zinc finger domain-containing protein [Ditylenchus destructor]|uniref:FLYWCH zinc finger domain-containing protein n=1 Tax=Ditylenchus destructor TaxID=166010 RepID=A0AAD4MJI1_9BILA|nr:FLYWCH zinc finger domain-containing protein [Ditylenchus destructor]